MVPHRLRSALLAIELVAGATLIRSIAFDRWITVLASVLLLAGAAATHRGRTWGVALALAAAAAFPVAWAIGIAPFWFCLVGAVGALPFALIAKDMARYDARATALLTGLATSLGAAGAIMWKHYAFTAFMTFPILMPSLSPHHGLAIAALLTAAVVAHTRRRERESEGEGEASVPAASETRMRIGALDDAAHEVDATDDRLLEEEETADRPAFASRRAAR